VSWGDRFIGYFGLSLVPEIAGLIGFVYPFCNLGDEGCRPVK
jgi:hypothetical protein